MFTKKKVQISRVSSEKESLTLVLIAVIAPLPLLFLNPDLIHDPFFLSQAKGIESGLTLYKDIYSVYGPLTTWFVHISNLVFENAILNGRILGFLVNAFTLICLYRLMIRFTEKRVSARIVLLYSLLNSGISEISSPRWPFSFGVWPTSVSVLACLISLQVLLPNPKDSLLASKGFTRHCVWSFLQGVFVGLSFYSRLQSILIGSVLFFSLMTSLKRERSKSPIKLFFLYGLLIGIVAPAIYLFKMNSLNAFLQQYLFGSFAFAQQHFSGSLFVSANYLQSLFFSITLGILGFSIVFLFLSLIVRTEKNLSSVIFLSGSILGAGSYLASLVDLPEDLNRNPVFWFIKWVSQPAGFFVWPIFIFCVVGIFFRGFLEITSKFSSQNSKTTLQYRKTTFELYIYFLSCLTLLYVNFGYVYQLLPITIVFYVYVNSEALKSDYSFLRKVVDRFFLFGVFLFATLLVIGLSKEKSRFASEELRYMYTTAESSGSFDGLTEFAKPNLAQGVSSMYLCDYTFLRLFDPSSYAIDSKFYQSPPFDLLEYFDSIPVQVGTVVSCNEESTAELLLLISQNNASFYLAEVLKTPHIGIFKRS